MNIFVLDLDPIKAAEAQCNKHVVKMCIETAQLLVAANKPGLFPWGITHVNHPCAKWVRESAQNYEWTLEHGIALCKEYTKRYEKVHAAQGIIALAHSVRPRTFNSVGLTPFAIAIKDTFYHVPNDPVTSYRAYYIGEKSKFAKWAPKAMAPSWWPWSE